MSARQMIPTFRQTFWHGVVAGVGWAIGATLVFAIGLTILSSVVSLLGKIPFIGDLIKPMDQIVNQSEDPRRSIIERHE
jgi:uncharacterized membrane protein